MLPCRASGHPTPRVKWYRDGTTLQSGNRYTIVQGGSLRIDGKFNCDKESRGYILCNKWNWRYVIKSIRESAIKCEITRKKFTNCRCVRRTDVRILDNFLNSILFTSFILSGQLANFLYVKKNINEDFYSYIAIDIGCVILCTAEKIFIWHCLGTYIFWLKPPTCSKLLVIIFRILSAKRMEVSRFRGWKLPA